MTAFILRRLAISAILLFFVSIVAFLIITLAPGSPYPWGDLNPKISPAVQNAFRKRFHLDQPIYKQYLLTMRDLFSGDLRSTKDDRPVLQKIAERLPATLKLNILALTLAFTFGILLGVFCVRHYGRAPDTFASLIAFILIALPSFWISYLITIALVKVFAVPILGTQSYGIAFSNDLRKWLDTFWHLALPATVLSLNGIAVQSRFIRASMAETLKEDYIRTARAKGLPEDAVFYKHALRNSIRPLVTGLGYLLPALLGGSVIVETIFAYPGIGRLGYQAVLDRDYPSLIALNFITAALVLLGNLFADLLYAVVDPRVRLE
ncbi:MAG: peptide ABC transporter permease [Verrucomicrobia bacterium]|nr:MAG: peptide ABC transporter permease [Verrucomicrobiota bacterium]